MQPFKAYSGKIPDKNLEVVVVWAGGDPRFPGNNVGTTASTASAYASILGFQPDLVHSAGTAGGFSSTSAVGVREFLVSRVRAIRIYVHFFGC